MSRSASVETSPARPGHARSVREARLRLLLAAMVPAWGRVVVALVATSFLVSAAGLSDVAGYATIPAIYLAISPPVGRPARRVASIVLAGALIALLSAVAAELTRSTAAVVAGLAVTGVVAGLLPRLGPRAAAMQLPLLMGFAYSAGHPLTEASAGSRALAVLVALPAYALAAGVVLRVEQRRPIVTGAAAALQELASALGDPPARGGEAGAATRRALAALRTPLSRLRDTAMPLSAARGDRAHLWLLVSVQDAITGAELTLAGDPPQRPERSLVTLARSAHDTAAMLEGAGRPAPAKDVRAVADRAAEAGDGPLELLARALADAARAATIVSGDRHAVVDDAALGALPPAGARLWAALDRTDPILRRAVRLGVAAALAGLVAELFDLGRAYWPVFAVVIIFNAPAARDWRRALERIAGTAVGLLLAVPLIELAGQHRALGLLIGLVLLLPGLVLMPVSYSGATLCITAAVGVLFASGGDADDFLTYRLGDTLVGAGVAIAVGLLLWHTSAGDWWVAARRMAAGLAAAVCGGDLARSRQALVLDLLALRAQTAETAAMPGEPGLSATWVYTAAAERLVRTLSGPRAEPLADPHALHLRLRALEARCADPGAAAAAPASVATAVELEVAEMEGAVESLRSSQQPATGATR